MIALVRVAAQSDGRSGSRVESGRGPASRLAPLVSLVPKWGNSKATQSAGAGGWTWCPSKDASSAASQHAGLVATAGRSWPARRLAGRLQARPPSREGGEGAGEQGAPEARRGPTGSDHHGRAAHRRPSRSGAGRGDQQRRRRRQARAEAGHRDGGTAHEPVAQRYLDREGRGAAGTACVGSGLGGATGHHPRLCGQGSKVRSAPCGAPAGYPDNPWSTRTFMHKPSRCATGDRLSHNPRPALSPGPRNRSTLQGTSRGAAVAREKWLDPGNWASLKPFGIGEQHPNNYLELWKRLQGEPRPGPLCLAHPHPGDLRRLRPWHQGHARLDHPAGSSLQRPPAAAAVEHHAGAGHRPARRRRAAGGQAQRRAARPRPPPLPDGAPPGRAGLHPDRLGRGPRPDRRARSGPAPPNGWAST